MEYLIVLAIVASIAIPVAEVFVVKRLVEKKGNLRFDGKVAFFAFTLIGVGFFLSGSGLEHYSVVHIHNEKFSKEVDLHQVTVKGEQSFNAQIVIKYRDGKIAGIDPIKGTTVLNKKDKDEGEEDGN